MCVVCRERLEQGMMFRFQCENGTILKFRGFGRSFYICKTCINNPKLDKIMKKICKTKNVNIEKLKEIDLYEA
jgi:predicted RNA-binding protein YlxR (DUF448 family)